MMKSPDAWINGIHLVMKFMVLLREPYEKNDNEIVTIFYYNLPSSYSCLRKECNNF